MLAAFEDALVALSTDASLRRRFAREGAGALREFSLDARERAALASLPLEALERYARSLVSKRWGEVAKVMPMTLRVAPSVERRYRAWLAVSPAPAADTVLGPGHAEAQRALATLHAQLNDDAGEAPYAADLLAYEVLASCTRIDGVVRGMRTRHPLPEIVADLARGLVPVDPEPVQLELRFERDGVRHRSVS